MKNFYVLSSALALIEHHLTEPMTQQQIADACYVSLSNLQKLFRYCFHLTLKEYITKRRLTCAAQQILSSDKTITQIALAYQYQSPEVFSRAFSRVWGTTPSNYRQAWRFTGLMPPIHIDQRESDKMKRKVDISELYDLLIQRAECYVLCFDMVHMTQINAISQQAGDRAILECLKRLDDATGENMLLFRIGGDEFALVTDLTDPESVRALAMQILARNDEPLIWEGRPIKLALRAGATRIRGGNLRYPALFSRLHETIASSRQAGELVFCDD